MRYAELWPRYAGYWDKMVIKPERVAGFESMAKIAIANKAIYQRISNATQAKVPWEMLACCHRRESDSNFATYLGNGQSLAVRTTIVPKDRGPFCHEADIEPYIENQIKHGKVDPTAYPGVIEYFVTGGIDAVKVEGWGSILDWRLEKELYYILLFNGTGTEPFHPSSYIWGGTNIQIRGKWIRDHVYDSSVWDPQPGCAPLLKTIAQLDPTVTFTRET